MATFKYQAVGDDGTAATGVVEAPDRRGALEELAGRGLFPSALQPLADSDGPTTSCRPSQELARPAAESALLPPGGVRVSRKQVTAFTRQMGTLLAATIPIPTALVGLAEQESNPRLQLVIQDIADGVKRGDAFSLCLTRHPKVFPSLFTSMVEVGEESGRLPDVLEDLANYLEEQDEMRSEILSAVAYPVFVLGLGVATSFVLLAFVMPKLLGILDGLTATLPLPTRILLGISGFLSQWWPACLVVIVGGAIALRAWIRSGAGGLTWDEWKLKCPGMGQLFTAAALSRFSHTLGTLHRAGVSLLRALEIVRNTVGNRYISERIDQIAEETKGGDSLAAPIRKLELFPPTMVQMIAVGEDTGRLDDMLLKVARIQERRVKSQSRALISLLGPALIVAIGVVIGFIVISLLLPIFQISQSMR